MKLLVALARLTSVAVTENVNVPALVGRPPIWPVFMSRYITGGSAPDVTVQV